MDRLELDDVQRLVVQGYPGRPAAAYALLTVVDAPQAKIWLRAQLDQGAIGTADRADRPRDLDEPDRLRLSIAFTWEGLRVLGFQDDPGFEGFVGEFREGMVAPHRSRILGDVGESAPQNWEWGQEGDPVHVLLMAFATLDELETSLDRLREELSGLSLGGRDPLIGYLRGDGKEHFGFRDGISQPYIEGSDTSLRPSGRYAHALTVKPGEFILGYPNEFGRLPASPSVPVQSDPWNHLQPHGEAPTKRRDFGRNGSYLVMRQLEQHVEAFETYLRSQAGTPEEVELLAAKLVGRWKSGAPLVLAPERDDRHMVTSNGFGFHELDRHGFRCPVGSHIRRANPRDSLTDVTMNVDAEEAAHRTNRHRLIRRGRLYEREHRDGDESRTERGLLFLCLNANIQRQFEFVQQHWINGEKFGDLYDERDPLIGAQPAGGGAMTIQGCPISRRLKGIPRFVTVRGGAYFFLPGLKALRVLAELP